jgi:hypothetical protein
MITRKTGRKAADVRVGYAADERGEGVAYALVGSGAGESLMRVGFRTRRLGGVDGREIGYAALTAVVGALRGRGSRALELEIADDAIVAEVEGRRPIPPALAMPYVTLRCSLNGLAQARIRSVHCEKVADLEARARAEVSLHVAA